MKAHQGLNKKVLGARKAKKGLGYKLEEVKDSGTLWRNQKIEQVMRMLSKKTRLLNVLVTRLLMSGRRISPMVVELLNIVGGESAAQALSEIHARTECPTVSFDPVEWRRMSAWLPETSILLEVGVRMVTPLLLLWRKVMVKLSWVLVYPGPQN